MIDLDELQSVQSRERQTDSLQQLRESFYREAGQYIESLREERERAAERADDPWTDPEVSRLSDDIDTAEDTVEAIYERRVGKIVKMASLAAADMPTEDDGLTAEERDLFETLVESIERNRGRVEAVLGGEAHPGGSESPQQPESQASTAEPSSPDSHASDRASEPETRTRTEPAKQGPQSGPPPSQPEEEEVTAADLMGGDDANSPTGGAQGPPVGDDTTGSAGSDDRAVPPREPLEAGSGASGEESTDSEPVPDIPTQGGGDANDGAGGDPGPDSGSSGGGHASDDGRASDDGHASDGGRATVEASPDQHDSVEEPQVDRATVKMTEDVGEIFGVDERSYDLTSEDVVRLPEANAEPLVERDAAERLD